MLAGLIEVRYQGIVRASGGMALFVIVWFSQPLIAKNVVNIVPPSEPAAPVALAFLDALDEKNPILAYSMIGKAGRDTFSPDITDFQTLFNNVRLPVGKSLGRTLVNMNSLQSPSGYPIGLYDLLTYRTRFSTTECRLEAVALRASDKIRWEVFTYQISPPTPCT